MHGKIIGYFYLYDDYIKQYLGFKVFFGTSKLERHTIDKISSNFTCLAYLVKLIHSRSPFPHHQGGDETEAISPSFMASYAILLGCYC